MILYDTLLFTYILQSIFILDSESLFTCFMITSWSSLPPLIFNMNKKKLDWVLIKATDRTFL